MKHLLLSISFLLLLSCSKDDEVNSENNNPPSTLVSLPVKVIRKDAGGVVTRTSTFTYDSQRRRNIVKFVDSNPELSATSTYSYKKGEITVLHKYDNTAKPLETFIFFYNANGMVKEEFYLNNKLTYIYEWFHRPDGGKERRIKNNTNKLVQTYYYRFTSAGNIDRVVLDYADPADEDEETTYTGFDNKHRAVNSYITNVIAGILLEIEGTKLSIPNNNTRFTRKKINSGALITDYKIEYKYNIKQQVTEAKMFQASNGALAETYTIEYEDF